MVALQDLYEFLDASIMVQTSPEEAYRKLVQTTQIQFKYEMKAAQHTHTKRMIHAWNAVLCALSCQNQIFCLVLALYFVHSLFLLVVILLPLYEGTTS
jgi:hypothetical protein